MAKKKQDWLDQLVSGLSVRSILLNPGTMGLIVSIATIAATIHLWNQHQSSIMGQEDFVLTADKIRLTQPPDWVDQDLRERTVHELILASSAQSGLPPESLSVSQSEPESPLSLLDTHLISRTGNVLQSIGWIESISSISKSRSGVDVELTYRTPIGLVELNRKTVSRWPQNKEEQLVPIDRMGIVLPDKVMNSKPLLRITLFEPQRQDHFGDWTQWPDERIEESAAIGDFLKDHWQAFGFYRIMSYRLPNQPADASTPYQLWTDTRQAAKVIWGSPPGKELPGEAAAKTKLELLEKFYTEQGPMNQLSAVVIDLRSGVVVTNRDKTASREGL